MAGSHGTVPELLIIFSTRLPDDMIWYDMIWHDMIWYDMIYVLWYMIWYDIPFNSPFVDLFKSETCSNLSAFLNFRSQNLEEKWEVPGRWFTHLRGCVSHRPWNSGDLPSVSMVPCSMVHADLPESSAPTESARSSWRRHCRKAGRSRSSGRRDRHAMKTWTKES